MSNIKWSTCILATFVTTLLKTFITFKLFFCNVSSLCYNSHLKYVSNGVKIIWFKHILTFESHFRKSNILKKFQPLKWECNLGSWKFFLWFSQNPPLGVRMHFIFLGSCHVSNLHSTSFLLFLEGHNYHFWELVTSPYLGYETVMQTWFYTMFG